MKMCVWNAQLGGTVRVCVCARRCVTFARMMLTHVNVKIHSAVRYRPLDVYIAFHVPHFSIIR